MAERLPRSFDPLPRVTLRAGQAPVRQGERSPGVWRVESGVLSASAVDDEGRELTLDLLGPGDVAGEPGGGVSAVTLRAVRPTCLHAVDPAEVAELLAGRARRRETLACDLAWRGVEERVMRRLEDLAARFGRPVPAGVSIWLPLTQEDLASLAGTSRESANRALRRLVRDGRVSAAGRGRYVVHRHLRPVPP
jgi:CRP/FNR family transcriptional regulator, cyclic AMP receptor protein